ncbi:class I SAM-dependent methyltransferase [Sinisalibacter aestuarii]|uniref:ATP synthase subunit beta n=1 Tax=Sinisalibacter aestuarii TaxID=2949426 RepID=A0ABQ5LPT6_9RHOB|nr:SAM-dependent methyltransferase [Sinisalibacter aestuarii]GKY87017.1 ATP synthase subunit beta [Sinisalibacter aestuarii]
MSLRDALLARIAETGPMPVSDYMAECLTHPTLGYYTTRDPLGAAGDFTTAPEVSQMFGELVGLALAQGWLDQGAPAPFTLAELGPGRGTLMADILRATRGVPGFHTALRLHLVEASPPLREKQRTALAGMEVTHHDSATTLPDAPLFLVANEFFDALPIRQFVRAGAGWRERLVGAEAGALAFGLGGPAHPGALAARDDVPEGKLVETCPSAPAIMAEIEARIATQGGAALVIDYGDWRSLGDTLQALRAHRPESPLANPGAADLTAHVDFEALTLATPRLAAAPLTPQGVFLERLGITQRARMLATRLSGAALDSHIAAHRRLTHPDEMGTLFKVLALMPMGAPMLPGLEP